MTHTTQAIKPLEELLLRKDQQNVDGQGVTPNPHQNAILYAYMMILTAVHVSLIGSQTSAKELSSCQSNMSKENSVQNNLNFKMPDKNGQIMKSYSYQQYWLTGTINGQHVNALLTSKAGQIDSWMVGAGYHIDGNLHKATLHGEHLVSMTQHDYDTIQMNDQQVEKDRQYFSNKIVILQQCSQSLETNIGSKNDFMAQFIQEDTNFSTVLTSIAGQLGQMLRSL